MNIIDISHTFYINLILPTIKLYKLYFQISNSVNYIVN